MINSPYRKIKNKNHLYLTTASGQTNYIPNTRKPWNFEDANLTLKQSTISPVLVPPVPRNLQTSNILCGSKSKTRDKQDGEDNSSKPLLGQTLKSRMKDVICYCQNWAEIIWAHQWTSKYHLSRRGVPLATAFMFCESLKQNEVHKGPTIWIHGKNTGPYLLVTKGTHTITHNLHNCFPLVVKFIFDL